MVLRLLCGLELNDPYAENAFAERYDRCRNGVEAPTLRELAHAGWVKLGLGRVHLALDLRLALDDPPDDVPWAKPLRDALPTEHQVLTLPVDAPAELTEAEDPQESTRAFIRATRDPHWVAARVWEHACAQHEEACRLRWWLARWRLLGYPFFTPWRAWRASEHHHFAEQCAALLADEDLPSWAQAHEHAAVQMTLRSRRLDVEKFRPHVPEPPSSWIERQAWLHRVQFDVVDEPLGDYGAVMHLWLNDVIGSDQSSSPHPTIEKLLPLVDRSPHLLGRLVHIVRRSPALLADFAISPRSAGWAAHLAADWKHGSGAWDVGLASHRAEDRRRAFDAIVDVLCDHVSGRHRDEALAELLALLRWLETQRRARDAYGRNRLDHDIVDTAWRLLPLDDSSLASAMLMELTTRIGGEEAPVGGTSLPVALRVVERAGELPGLEATRDALVAGYVRSFAALPYAADDVYPSSALLRLASEDDAYAKQVLTPFDFETHAKEAFYLEPSTRSDRVRDLSRGLRLHLRFLAACLCDPRLETTDALLDAATRHLDLGSMAHLERGRVDAVGVSHSELWSSTPDPLPPLLGRALRRLDKPKRDRLLGAITRTDDPTFLARIMIAGPPGIRDALRARLSELGPTKAAPVLDLGSLRVRRNALLAAGETELAAAFLTHEKEMATLGPVRGRRADELAFELRLLFAEERYDDIVDFDLTAAELPTDTERQTAERSHAFYCALVELTREGGDLDAAEEHLVALSKREPLTFAYAVNLHAARIKRALRAVPSPAVAAKLEAEGARLLQRSELSDKDKHTVEANLALVDNHIGKYRRALERLRRLPEQARFAELPTATAVDALAHLGEYPDARAWIETAAEWTGWTDVLTALREGIEAKRELASGDVSASVPEDAIGDRRTQIGASLEALRHLPIEEQTLIASGQPDLRLFLVELLSQGAAGLQDHSPTLVSGETVPHFEDNLTRLLASLIRPCVRGLDWSLHTHPHRGGTARDPTIPDLVFKRDEVVLGIVEAVWGPRPKMNATVKKDLRQHLKKTFSYGPARYFFHLIYTEGGTISEILDEAAGLAEHESPPEFTCIDKPEIIQDFGAPPAVVSIHHNPRSDEPITLTQLVLDLGRKPEHDAHATSKKPG